jgi:hypothetical protein
VGSEALREAGDVIPAATAERRHIVVAGFYEGGQGKNAGETCDGRDREADFAEESHATRLASRSAHLSMPRRRLLADRRRFLAIRCGKTFEM